MTNVDAINKQDQCNCGRSSIKTHCPICGRANFYALKDKVERFHPVQGTKVICNQYRCRGCNGYFDDMQWKYACQAPAPVTAIYKEQKELTKTTWIKRAESREKFDINMKRAFRKAVGVGYEDFMQISQNADNIRIKREFAKLQHAIETPKPVVIHTGSAAKPATPYDAHLEQCQTCMIASDRNEHCEAGRILLDLKNGVQP